MTYIVDEEASLKNSALRLFIGDSVGSGASRRVYEVKDDPTKVIKLEYTGYTFHNQMEWLVWKEIKDWPIADWFAKCHDIDGYGNALIQERSVPFTNECDFHDALRRTRGGVIPRVFDDVHYGNFGIINGVVACHDYGYTHFFAQVAREMSIEAGYITIDEPDHDVGNKLDITEEKQFVFNL